jgi:two-component system, NarL family, nitrate/nitrite response regulator NarL
MNSVSIFAMHVLLVDDHPIIHETIRAIVRSLRPGAEVHSQFDLAGGLSEAKRLDPLTLVLLDLGLPGCAGIEALVRFRRAMPQARVAILSATEDDRRVSEALDGGAVGYLPKTLRPKLMADALRTILDGGTYRPPSGPA